MGEHETLKIIQNQTKNNLHGENTLNLLTTRSPNNIADTFNQGTLAFSLSRA